MFVLQLNDMRDPNIEIVQPVCRAETEQELKDFLAKEEVEPYRDDSWGKSYRKGGPLEWFNPPFSINEAFVDVGTVEDWQAKAVERYNKLRVEIPEAMALSGDGGNG